MAEERLQFEDVQASLERLKGYINELHDLKDEFTRATNQINEGGSDLGGNLGEFADSFLKNEIAARLDKLAAYITEFHNAIGASATREEETMQKATQTIQDI